MIPNIDSKAVLKTFEVISGIFVTVNFDGKYLTWIKIPRMFDVQTNRHYNAYCFEQKCLDYFNDDIKVTDPTNVNMKVEF